MQYLPPGTLLQGGRYRIEEKIGQGGFGITYRCTQVYLMREVVIKEFFIGDYCVRNSVTGEVSVPSVAPRETVKRYRKKFIKEAHIISSLNHHGIVNVHDIFEEKGTAYYVMEYLKGKSLSQVIDERRELPEEEAISYVIKVGNALKYIHDKHINHLDVKPGNIILCDDGRVMLIDFGISKQYNFETDQGTTTTPAGISPGYSPIEQYLQQGVATFSPQSDVYALAATAYKLLTGARPPEALTINETHLRSELAHHSISKHVINAIVAAMKRERDLRTQSITEFLNQLSPKTPLKTGGSSTVSIKPSIDQLINNAKAGNADAQFQLGKLCEHGDGVTQNLSEAVEWYRKAAQQGHIEAQNNYASLLGKGKGVPQDTEQAAYWFRKAAEKGLAIAQYNLGICYLLGKGAKKDISKAVYWFQKAAAQGDVKAQYQLGQCYYEGNNYTKAVEWYQKAAKQGDAYAQFNLGRCYYYGEGVSKNIQQAIVWFKKAAAQGNAEAQMALSQVESLNSPPTPQEKLPKSQSDPHKRKGKKTDKNAQGLSIDQLVKKAVQGNPDAQFLLGKRCENGDGVTPNLSEAVKWYRKAAQQGHAEAQNNYASMLGKGKGVPQDIEKAVYWFRKAAEKGLAIAQYNLGTCFLLGKGEKKDLSKAVYWFQKAAAQGDAKAQYQLGNCCFEGEGIEDDYAKAVEWYRKAAKQGHAEAQFKLGECYYYGDGTKRDSVQAVKWYRKAAEQGLACAQYELGDCYLKGDGIKKDYEKAVTWFQKAAAQGNAEAQKALSRAESLNSSPTPPPKKPKSQSDPHEGKGKITDKNAQGLSIDQLVKEAVKGNPDAQFELGKRCEHGFFVTQDLSEAVKWYRKAAQQGHAEAQNNYASMLGKGKGVPQDTEQAAYWFRKAAEKGLAIAQYNLGICFLLGKGEKKDKSEAIYWLQKSAAQGHDNALNQLKRLSENGEKKTQRALKQIEVQHTPHKTTTPKQIRELPQQAPAKKENDNVKPKSSTSYFGWIIALILLGILLFFFFRNEGESGTTKQVPIQTPPTTAVSTPPPPQPIEEKPVVYDVNDARDFVSNLYKNYTTLRLNGNGTQAEKLLATNSTNKFYTQWHDAWYGYNSEPYDRLTSWNYYDNGDFSFVSIETIDKNTFKVTLLYTYCDGYDMDAIKSKIVDDIYVNVVFENGQYLIANTESDCF